MSAPGPGWHLIGPADELEVEDVMPFDHKGHEYAIYHSVDGFFASDGMCSHEQQALADGLVIGNVIECPLHQGRFDIRSGKALSAPVCVDLQTFPIALRDGLLYIQIPDCKP